MPRRFVHALKKSLRSRDRSLEAEEAQGLIVWDALNPFAPPDHVRKRIDAETARVRRYEMLTPHKWVDDDDVPWGSESDDDDENEEASSDKDDIGRDIEHDADDEGDHEDDDVDNMDLDENQDGQHSDKLSQIALLPLPAPLRFLHSSESSPATPSLLLSPFYENISVAAHIDDGTTEDERALHKTKRDLRRSRSKAIAILGPETSCAF